MKQLVEDIKSCAKCELHTSATKKVIGRGSMTPKVLFIGEAPGAEEDKTGRPFCGRSGQLLQSWIDELELTKEDYAIINCLKCRPPENADPTREQLDACREWLDKQIEALDPEYIILVGRFAAKEVGDFDGSITKNAGRFFINKGYTYFTIPHPSYYLRQGGFGWEKAIDMIKAFIETKRSIPERKMKVPHPEKPMMVEQEKPNFVTQQTHMGQSGLTKGGMRQPPYVPLHFHTTYSIGDSCTVLPKMVDKAKEMGFDSLAITDHGTISGWWEFQKECERVDIKPLFGVEFYVADNFEDKNKTRYHILVLAKDDIGVKNIFRLNELAHSEGYYYKPRIRLQDLLEHSEGLVVTSACVLGVVALKGKEAGADEAENIALMLKETFGEDFYLEIQLHDFDDQRLANILIMDIARRREIPLIVTSDCHYLTKDNKKVHDALKAVMHHKKYGEGGFSIDSNYLLSMEDLYRDAKRAGISKETIDNCVFNSREIADKCNARLSRVKNAMPKFKG